MIAYYKNRHLSVNYGFVMFYGTGPTTTSTFASNTETMAAMSTMLRVGTSTY
jgi:hypothetical protein